jgi:hypothetical protein
MILAPHTDDGELGGGGTIAKLSAEGKEVFYAAFCTNSKALPKPSNTLEQECKKGYIHSWHSSIKTYII